MMVFSVIASACGTFNNPQSWNCVYCTLLHRPFSIDEILIQIYLNFGLLLKKSRLLGMLFHAEWGMELPINRVQLYVRSSTNWTNLF
jgi:hypothetical protein